MSSLPTFPMIFLGLRIVAHRTRERGYVACCKAYGPGVAQGRIRQNKKVSRASGFALVSDRKVRRCRSAFGPGPGHLAITCIPGLQGSSRAAFGNIDPCGAGRREWAPLVFGLFFPPFYIVSKRHRFIENEFNVPPSLQPKRRVDELKKK